MKRRDFLAVVSAAVLAGNDLSAANPASKKTNRLGLVTYCCRIRDKLQKKANPKLNFFDPPTFLVYCHQVGAGGMQIDLGVLSSNEAGRLRERAAELGMFVEAIVSVPKQKPDLDDFEAKMRTASEVGVAAARTTIIPGRRYEYFDTLAKFREYDARGRRALELAAPIAEKYRVHLGVENHKDHRNAERVALFEHIGSEYVGACVDIREIAWRCSKIQSKQ